MSFKRYSNNKFHENPYSGSRVVARGQTDRQTDLMMKLTVAFCNVANVPKTDKRTTERKYNKEANKQTNSFLVISSR